MGATERIVLLVVAAVVVLATGLMLTRAGRPYRTLALNVHKLVDLAAVVVIVAQVAAAVRGPGLATIDWVLVVSAAILVVATFATGGVVSASDSAAHRLVVAHRLLPWPLLAVLVATVYRLAGRS